MTIHPLAQLPDAELLTRVLDAATSERAATAKLIALLAELDARRLFLGEGCSSLFTYCTQVLRLSEHAAYNRIETARAARRFPMILDLVEAGAITLTNVRLLAPHLTDANHRDLLERARHKLKRDIELLIVTIRPSADVPSVVRKLPTPLTKPKLSLGPDDAMKHDEAVSSLEAEPSSTRADAEPTRIQPAASVKPLSPERYKIQVTVSRETYAMLRRAQDLLRHSVPNGDAAVIIARALELLVSELERRKVAATDRPYRARVANPRSRHIPADIRRAVWRRDDGRCRFIGSRGRCEETGFLEYHHVVPFADGGQTAADNLELRCRAHNRYEADLWSGAASTPHVRENQLVW
jgi:5-methylcytosine-specific restriction endonuclease McrA